MSDFDTKSLELGEGKTEKVGAVDVVDRILQRHTSAAPIPTFRRVGKPPAPMPTYSPNLLGIFATVNTKLSGLAIKATSTRRDAASKLPSREHGPVFGRPAPRAFDHPDRLNPTEDPPHILIGLAVGDLLDKDIGW